VKLIKSTQCRNSSAGWPRVAPQLVEACKLNHNPVTFLADARKEELPGRLDLPGRPGDLKKPIAPQSEKDQLIDAVRES
jgi:hypothetical protein